MFSSLSLDCCWLGLLLNNNYYIYIDTLRNPIVLHSLHMAKPSENTFINLVVYTQHNCLIRTFGTLSILLIPSRPLRLSICTALALNPSFSFFPYHCFTTIHKSSHEQSLKQELSELKLQTPSINQRPNNTCNPPPTRHLPTTLFHLYLIHPNSI